MLTPYQFASNTPIQAIDLDGLEAWPITRNWAPEDIEGYAKYAKTKIAQYQAEGIKDDCANFALRLIVGYASENGLPLVLKNSTTTFDASSTKYKTKKEYLNAVRINIQAKDLILNTYGVNQSETNEGDLILIHYDKYNYDENNEFDHVVIFSDVSDENYLNSKSVYGNLPADVLKVSQTVWPRKAQRKPDKESWTVITGEQDSRWNVLNPANMPKNGEDMNDCNDVDDCNN